MTIPKRPPRSVPQARLGPGSRVHLNAAGKRLLAAQVKLMKHPRRRAVVVAGLLTTGAMTLTDVTHLFKETA